MSRLLFIRRLCLWTAFQIVTDLREIMTAFELSISILSPPSSLLPLAPRALPLLLVHADGDHGIDRRAFADGELHQLMRENMQLMEGVVSQIRLTIALVD